MKHTEEQIREALVRLSMCARKECEHCKHKDRPTADLPSDTCKKRSVKNMNILADVCLSDVPPDANKKVKRTKHHTLCWDCAKACGRCSWSKNFTPVENWVAVPTKIEASQYGNKSNTIDSYDVYECPEFELHEKLKKKRGY